MNTITKPGVQWTYRVHYMRNSDGAKFTRDFSTHVAAKAFAGKKMAEPGWLASWPVKVALSGGAA